MSENRVGFIGVGVMGRGMIANLIQAGFALTLWNRTRSKCEEFTAQGAFIAETPAEVATTCDIVFICVSDTPDVQAVVTGENGILKGLRPNGLIIDTSTISPHATRDLAQHVNAQGGHWLDAPVSGGAEGARRGTLSVMVGGEAEQVHRAMPYLQAIGKTITHMGENGTGQLVKLVNQILVVVNMLAVSEALVFAKAGGLDLEKTIQAVSGGAAGSWMLSNRGKLAIERDFSPLFTIDLQQKDLRLVLESGDKIGVPLVATSLVYQLYRTLQAEGFGGEGNHALIRAIEKLSGVIAEAHPPQS